MTPREERAQACLSELGALLASLTAFTTCPGVASRRDVEEKLDVFARDSRARRDAMVGELPTIRVTYDAPQRARAHPSEITPPLEPVDEVHLRVFVLVRTMLPLVARIAQVDGEEHERPAHVDGCDEHRLKEDFDWSWARLLLTPDDQRPLEQYPLPPLDLPTTYARRVLRDVLADLGSAMKQLVDQLPFPLPLADEPTNALRELWNVLGIPGDFMILEERLDLMSVAEFANELQQPAKQVRVLVDNGQLIAVERWNGERQIPEFQQLNGDLVPITGLYRRIDRTAMSNWELALLADRAIKQFHAQAEDRLEAFLRDRQLLDAGGELDDMEDLLDEAVGQPTAAAEIQEALHRITERRFGPFYFSAADDGGTGRFDLREGDGSCYLARTASGAIGEFFDRVPVVSLTRLSDLHLWCLRPPEDLDLELRDLTGMADLCNSPVRAGTQAVAQQLHERANDAGILACARSNNDEEIMALFGPAGATLPAAAELGSWEARSHPLLKCRDFWRYVEARDAAEDGEDALKLPVLFQVLPGVLRDPLPDMADG